MLEGGERNLEILLGLDVVSFWSWMMLGDLPWL